MQEERGALKQEQAGADRKKTVAMISGCFYNNFYYKMVDYLKKALIYGHTSRISS